MWAIWFCHELLPEHKQVLQEALTSLLAASKNFSSWKEENHILRNLDFSSPSTLSKLRSIWNIWLNHDFGSVEEAKKRRMAKMTEDNLSRTFFTQRTENAKLFADSYCASSLDDSSPAYRGMLKEILSYIEEGSVFAETVLGLEVDIATTVNPTLYQDKDSYSLHYSAIPFTCFFHVIPLSPKSDINQELRPNQVTVKDEWFELKRLLANSVQQFAVWVQAVQEVLLPGFDQIKPSFTLTMDCSDNVLRFCQEKQMVIALGSDKSTKMFDVIYTMLYSGDVFVLALVLSSLHLLKKKGIIFTTMYWYKQVACNIDKYLQETLGFRLEMLPVVCGLHLIGHEGRYADNTAFHNINPDALLKHSNTIAWQRVESVNSMQKMVDISQPEDIKNALCCSIMTSSLYYFVTEKHRVSLPCTETGVQLLLSFTAQLDQDTDVNDYHFWEHLCKQLINERLFEAFLTHLQTQALMHKLHLHLTVTETDCPLCNGQPLSNSIALYSVTFDSPLSKAEKIALSLLVFIYPDKSFIKSVLAEGVLPLLNGEYGLHIVDSFSCTMTNGKIVMDFYFPKKFAEQGYVCSVYAQVLSEQGHQEEEVLTMKLAHLKQQDKSYHFNEVSTSHCQFHSDLGLMMEHFESEERFHSKILINEFAMEKVKKHTLIPKTLSESMLKIDWGEYSLTLSYPYPFEHFKTDINTETRTLCVVVARESYQFQKRRRLYSTTPDNPLCFPAVRLQPRICAYLSRLQYLPWERDVISKVNFQPQLLPPEFYLKKVIKDLLEVPANEHFFVLKKEDEQLACLMVRDRMLFDVQAKSPAVDLYFHFVHNPYSDPVLPVWCNVIKREHANDWIKIVLEEDLALLRQCFFYFATHLKQKPSKTSPFLYKYAINQYFSRAVIYPLYIDADSYFQESASIRIISGRTKERIEMGQLSDTTASLSLKSPKLTSQVCHYCHSQSSNLLKCSQCEKASYCNRDCQRKHWKEHRPVCVQETPRQQASKISKQPAARDSATTSKASLAVSQETLAPSFDKCARCRRSDRQLKACRRCNLVAYCSKKCREKHLAKHAVVCKPQDDK